MVLIILVLVNYEKVIILCSFCLALFKKSFQIAVQVFFLQLHSCIVRFSVEFFVVFQVRLTLQDREYVLVCSGICLYINKTEIQNCFFSTDKSTLDVKLKG